MNYSRHILANGLRVLLHEDAHTPLVSVNLLYNVGARDEEPSRTGFAHLFEHLMFGGTDRFPDFDYVVDSLCGEANAFTNNDYTNYYMTVPADRLASALELEADRMRGLSFSQHSLEVQQQVVTEEYHQRYFGQPYADMWLHMRPLAYRVHPYRWCTIGADIRHVQQASLDEVRQFFYRYYRPNNAILAIAGNVKEAEMLRLVEYYFADIPAGTPVERHLPVEPPQTEARRCELEQEVPAEALYLAFPMVEHLHPDFPAFDLLSDLLSNGKSSRLNLQLVRERQLFTEVNAYVTGEMDAGLFVVSGKVKEGVALQDAEAGVWEELRRIAEQPVEAHELAKVINKYECNFVYSQYKAIDRAMALCFFEWIGHPEWVDDEPARYRPVTPDDIRRVAAQTFRPEQSNLLLYKHPAAPNQE